MCKMIKPMILAAMILCNVALLHGAADGNKILPTDLTFKTDRIDCGKDPHRIKVTYSYCDTVVGCVYYGARGTHEKFGKIETLRVEKEFRSQGFGSYILKQAMQALKDAGYNRVRLEAIPLISSWQEYESSLKRLITFYEKHGFKVLTEDNIQAKMDAYL